jgi:hypothetical protein
MNGILTYCPRCHFALEIPTEFDNVICGGCGTPYWVRRHGGALSLSEIWPGDDSPRTAKISNAIEPRLAEIDELIEEAESEIENLKSREQSAPLQMGCAFFGLLMTIIVLTALFMFLGKSYVGSWVFYATVAAVVLLGAARIRRKLIGPLEREKLRQGRIPIEGRLAQLQSERTRLQELKAGSRSEEP